MEIARKRGYYIYYVSENGLSGVEKKIVNQIKVFNRYFDVEGIGIEKEKTNLIKSCIWRLPFGSYGRNYDKAFSIMQEPDFVYIRFVPVDRRFLSFIRKIKERFPRVKIILEIPTFPYKGELVHDAQMWPFYIKDKIYNRYMKKYVNRIVTFSLDNEIMGVSTIHISNSLVVQDIKPLQNERVNNEINLLAVSTMRPSHGYERLIYGLKEYYENGENRSVVHLHFVGTGGEYSKYLCLVKQYGLEQYVSFYGNREKEELDFIYEKADLACGCFGLYKVGVEISSALKIREYLAKGLPVVSGCIEDVFMNQDVDFYMNLPNNRETIDIASIVKFYENLMDKYRGKLNLAEKIRGFAFRCIDTDKAMQNVVKYIAD